MNLRIERRPALHAAVSILGESLVIFGAAFLIKAWQESTVAAFAFTSSPYINAAIFTILCQASIYLCGLYDPVLQFGMIEQLLGLIQAFAIAFAVMAITLLLIGRHIDHLTILLGFLILLVITKTWRLIIQKLSAADLFRQRIILLGTGDHVRDIYQATLSDGRTDDPSQDQGNIDIVAVADATSAECSFPLQSETPYISLQDCHDLVELSGRYNTKKVIVCKQVADTLTPDIICDLKHKGLRLRSEEAVYEAVFGRRDLTLIESRELVFSDSFQHSIRRFFKRCTDVAAAFLLLLGLSPLILYMVVKLKCNRSGRIFDTQTCLGLRKKPFTRYFFASPSQDPCHPLNRRRSQGVPQLLNILKGDMSLIGPSPIGPQQAEKICHELPIFDERFTVRPGLTGWAQVNCGCDGSNKTAKHMFGYDLFYLKHMSLFLDIAVMSRAIRYQPLGGLLVGSNS